MVRITEEYYGMCDGTDKGYKEMSRVSGVGEVFSATVFVEGGKEEILFIM